MHPLLGDFVIIGQHEFTVSDAKKTRINRIVIRRLTPEELEKLKDSKHMKS